MDIVPEEVQPVIHYNDFSERLTDSLKEEISLCDNYVSRASLARMMNMSRESLCRKINHPEKISLEELAEMAAALGKSLHFYFK